MLEAHFVHELDRRGNVTPGEADQLEPYTASRLPKSYPSQPIIKIRKICIRDQDGNCILTVSDLIYSHLCDLQLYFFSSNVFPSSCLNSLLHMQVYEIDSALQDIIIYEYCRYKKWPQRNTC